jgi:hypothetical protein
LPSLRPNERNTGVGWGFRFGAWQRLAGGAAGYHPDVVKAAHRFTLVQGSAFKINLPA